MSGVAELLARVEKATGLDREIDWLIADELKAIPPHSVRSVGFDYDWYRRPGGYALWKANDSEGRNVSLWQPEKVTASIDAAVALVEKVLPDEEWAVSRLCAFHRHSHAALGLNGALGNGVGATPVLAILAALLRALSASPVHPQGS